MKKYILALDCGTSNVKTIVFDHDANVVVSGEQKIMQFYPESEFVEHDPMELWAKQMGVTQQILEKQNINPQEIAAIGIANQRETVVVWEKESGSPVTQAIVWQDRRGSQICEQWKKDGLGDYVKEATGLVIDTLFSAAKLRWLFDNIPGLQFRAEKGEVLVGTIDSWLVWKLTRGQLHITDYSNASRTMLFNINTLDWDDKILQHTRIPRVCLPQVRSSSECYGNTHPSIFSGVEVPIGSIIADQQASLFSHACFQKKGMTKSTYGVGAFMLMYTGNDKYFSSSGSLTTIAWGQGGKVEYAEEGSMLISGSAIKWLRDNLQLLHNSKDSEYYASQVKDTEDLYFVPSFIGLGTPHWNPFALGAILGLRYQSNIYHLVKATLEAICYLTRDSLEAIEETTQTPITELLVDGGATENNLLLQMQSDILGIPLHQPRTRESTAQGAAYMAGLAVAFWGNRNELIQYHQIKRTITPHGEEELRQSKYKGWKLATQFVDCLGKMHTGRKFTIVETAE